MSDRRCQGTTRAGKPCQAPPLKDRTHCRAHDPLTPADARFGSSEQASRAGALGGAAGRRPRVVDVIRERIEADMVPLLTALQDSLEAQRPVVVGRGEDAYVEMVPDYDIRIKAAAGAARPRVWPPAAGRRGHRRRRRPRGAREPRA
jgi:hypothetical protein